MRKRQTREAFLLHVVFRDFQICLVVPHFHGPSKPRKGSFWHSFISQHYSNVICSKRVPAPIGPPIPVKSGLAVAPNSLCVIIVVTEVELAANVSRFGTGKEKSK